MKNIWIIGLMMGIFFISTAGFAQYIVGDTVADFTLPDHTGTNVSLYDYSGDVILITFWTNF